MQAPLGLQAAVLSVRRETWALSIRDGCVHRELPLASGVLQGCPLASSVFVVAFDAALRWLESILGPLSTFACADDILLLLRSIGLLPQVANVSDVVSKATALNLSFPKCVAIPL